MTNKYIIVPYYEHNYGALREPPVVKSLEDMINDICETGYEVVQIFTETHPHQKLNNGGTGTHTEYGTRTKILFRKI